MLKASSDFYNHVFDICMYNDRKGRPKLTFSIFLKIMLLGFLEYVSNSLEPNNVERIMNSRFNNMY